MRKQRAHNLAYVLWILGGLLPAGAGAQATIKQQVSMAKELIPSIKTITVVCNVNDVQAALKEMKLATTESGLEFSVVDVKAFPELHKVFRTVSGKEVGLLWMMQDSVVGNDKLARRFVEENCIRKKIPLHAFSKEVLHEGALLFLSVEDGQPVFYINKAAAALLEFKPPPELSSKIVQVD